MTRTERWLRDDHIYRKVYGLGKREYWQQWRAGRDAARRDRARGEDWTHRCRFDGSPADVAWSCGYVDAMLACETAETAA